jgi:hypothetical protein
MASLLLGDKKQSVLEGLNKAESLFSSQTEQTPVSELEQLQRTLATLK